MLKMYYTDRPYICCICGDKKAGNYFVNPQKHEHIRACLDCHNMWQEKDIIKILNKTERQLTKTRRKENENGKSIKAFQ